MRELTLLVYCASPALAGRYLLSKRPILSKSNAYHLATLTVHRSRRLRRLLGFEITKSKGQIHDIRTFARISYYHYSIVKRFIQVQKGSIFSIAFLCLRFTVLKL